MFIAARIRFLAAFAISTAFYLADESVAASSPLVQSFKSTNITSPILSITKSGKPLANGLLVFTPQERAGEVPVLMTDSGDLVWMGQHSPIVANLFVQTLYGRPVLSKFTGVDIKLYAYGKITILDTTYTEIYEICPKLDLYIPPFVRPAPECHADMHESFITERNTLLFTTFNTTQTDLRSVGGSKDGWIFDSQFYEIDIRSKKILFKWSAIEHVPVSKSVIPLKIKGEEAMGTKHDPYDYFHINSVEPLDKGYLVNSRHTSTVYHVASTGDVAWEFSGRTGGDFAPDPNFGHFNYQHHARHRKNGDSKDSIVLHLFNNDETQFLPGSHTSTGLEFHLDLATNKSTLLRRLHDPKNRVKVIAEGDYFPLPNGNTLIGYGEVALIEEYGPDGDTDVRMRVTTVGGTYRAYRQEWHAVPASKPDVAIHENARKGWVSWNGATDVTRYVIYAGQNKGGRLSKVGEVRKSGFETEFDLPSTVRKSDFLQVGAFEGSHMLRKSEVKKVE